MISEIKRFHFMLCCFQKLTIEEYKQIVTINGDADFVQLLI